MRRELGSSALEVLLPVLVCAVLAAVWASSSTQSFVAQEYSGTHARTVLSIAVAAYRLQLTKSVLAVAPSSPGVVRDLATSFVSYLDAAYPPLSGDTCFVQGIGAPLPPAPPAALTSLLLPGLAGFVQAFDSEDLLNSYIASSSYPEPAIGKVWAAVVFNAADDIVDYSIRFNSSEVPATDAPGVDPLQIGPNFASSDAYILDTPSFGDNLAQQTPDNPVEAQPMPGFTSLQLAVDRFLLNRTAGGRFEGGLGNSSVYDPAVAAAVLALAANSFATSLSPQVAAAFQTWAAAVVGLVGVNPQILEPDGAAGRLLQCLGTWLQGELAPPQQVTFIPFPTAAYTQQTFFAAAQSFMALFVVISYLFVTARQIRWQVWEKETGLANACLLAGVPQGTLYFSWVLLYAAMTSVSAIAAAAVLSGTVLNTVNFVVVLLPFLLLSALSCVFSYCVATCFSTTRLSTTLGLVLFLSLALPYYGVSAATGNATVKLVVAFFAPSTGFSLVLDIFCDYAQFGQPFYLSQGALWAKRRNTSVAALLLCMAGGVLAYLLLGVWLEAFLLPKLRLLSCRIGCGWLRRETLAAVLPSSHLPTSKPSATSPGAPMAGCTLESLTEAPDSIFTEKVRKQQCVRIQELRKTFSTPAGAVQAVRGVSLEFVEGEIAVLLGLNGAGKTTLLQMLCGTLPVLDGDGDALVYGRSVRSELPAVRAQLGVVPQFDTLWPQLTVSEHLQLFWALRHADAPASRSGDGDAPKPPQNDPPEGIELQARLQRLQLWHRAHAAARVLSGGERRKLSLGLALLGDPRVLVLDEVSSAVDMYARTSIWELVKEAAVGRVVIVTTHYLSEEAEKADRIAIMHHGTLRCCGSPMWLKQAYGVGYSIVCLLHQQGQKPGEGQPVAVYSAGSLSPKVLQLLPEARLKSSVGAEIAFHVPLSASTLPGFSAVLRFLDGAVDAGSLRSFGLTVTSIEDVFVAIAVGDDEQSGGGCSGTELPAGTPAAASLSATTSVEAPKYGTFKVTAAADAPAVKPRHAWSLPFVERVRLLLQRRLRASMRDYRAMLCQLMIPFVAVVAGLLLIHLAIPTEAPDLLLSAAVLVPVSPADVAAGLSSVPVPTFPSTVYKANGTYAQGTAASDGQLAELLASGTSSSLWSLASPVFNGSDIAASAAWDAGGLISAPYGTSPAFDLQALAVQLLYRLAPTAPAGGSAYGALAFLGDGTSSLLGPSEVPGVCDALAAPTAPLWQQCPPASAAPGSGQGQLSVAVLHNTTAMHAAPLFLNLFTSALFAGLQPPQSPQPAIRVHSHPLPFTISQGALLLSYTSGSIATLMMIAFAFVPATIAAVVVRERESGAKMQLLLAGVSPAAYWVAHYLFDVAVTALAGVLCFAAFEMFAVAAYTSSAAHRVQAQAVLLALHSLALPPYVYVLSHAYKASSQAQVSVLVISLGAVGAMIVSMIMGQVLGGSTVCATDAALRYMWHLWPGFNLGQGMYSLAFLDILPSLNANCARAAGEDVTSLLVPYDAFDLKACGANMIWLAVQWLVYLVLAIVLDADGVNCCGGWGSLRSMGRRFRRCFGRLFPHTRAVSNAVLAEHELYQPSQVPAQEPSELALNNAVGRKRSESSSDSSEPLTNAGPSAADGTSAIAPGVVDPEVARESEFVRRLMREGSAASLVRSSGPKRAAAVRSSLPNQANATPSAEPFLTSVDIEEGGSLRSPFPLVLTLDIAKSFPAPGASKCCCKILPRNCPRISQASPPQKADTPLTITAVAGVTLQIPSAEIFGLVGANGAGKSTLQSILIGSAQPTSGQVVLCGMPLQRAYALQGRVGYCPQNDAFFDHTTMGEHVSLFEGLRDLAAAERGAEAGGGYRGDALLQSLGLTPFRGRIASACSGGQRRRLSVALALIGSPECVFCDESSNGCDIVSKRHMWHLLHDAVHGSSSSTREAEASKLPGPRGSAASKSRRVGCIVLTSHAVSEIEALCNRVGIMVDGRLAALGSISQLQSRYGHVVAVAVQVVEPPQAPSPPQLEVAGPSASSASTVAQADAGLAGSPLQNASPNMRLCAARMLPLFPPGCCHLKECQGSRGVFTVQQRSSANASAAGTASGAGDLKLATIVDLITSQKEQMRLHTFSVSLVSLEEIFKDFAVRSHEDKMASSS